NVVINANAMDSGSTISRVEFYLGGTLLGVDSTAPYSYTLVNPDPGAYVVSAKAIDAMGYSALATANFTVESLNYFWSTTGNIATGADTSFVGTVDTNRLAFRTNNIERMSILGDGTIGIGTKDTKGYTLAVNGKAIFTKVVVKPNGSWPDYVFRKDFHLPSLPELERYVRTHQHLPGIASEQEVKAGGIDVSHQEAALLKKVEELTLYLIEQNKKLETQQNKLECQQNMLQTQQKEIDALKAVIRNQTKQH
ncbi:MAG TPA: Ig-like domain-containing protein, partial [Bryobacteraceae bacterium]